MITIRNFLLKKTQDLAITERISLHLIIFFIFVFYSSFFLFHYVHKNKIVVESRGNETSEVCYVYEF